MQKSLRRYFYPRSPCGERRRVIKNSSRSSNNFYPRSPCGERRCYSCPLWGLRVFLSTLSLRRATNTGQPVRGLPSYFYPRSPCGERQCARGPLRARAPISIHALLAESDECARGPLRANGPFLSTLSLRRATKVRPLARVSAATQFLSTLSLRRATSTTWCSCPYILNFYPRSPCGERHLPAKWQKTA